MKNLLFLVMLIAIFGCRNTTANRKLRTDTLKAVNKKVVLKPDTIAVKRTAVRDTIRNEELTKMSEEFFQKAVVDLSDSSFTVYQNIRADYRIFWLRATRYQLA